MRRRSLWFIGPGAIEIRESAIPGPDEDRVLVQTHASAISAGTELSFTAISSRPGCRPTRAFPPFSAPSAIPCCTAMPAWEG